MPTPSQARRILERSREAAALDLLTLKERSLARVVVEWWLENQRPGAVLDALLSFPDYQIRRALLARRLVYPRTLVGEEGRASRITYRVAHLREPPEGTTVLLMSSVQLRTLASEHSTPEQRALWEERILPALFLEDASLEVRALAAGSLYTQFPARLPELTANQVERRRVFTHSRWSLSLAALLHWYLHYAPSLEQSETDAVETRLGDERDRIPPSVYHVVRAALSFRRGVSGSVYNEP